MVLPSGSAHADCGIFRWDQPGTDHVFSGQCRCTFRYAEFGVRNAGRKLGSRDTDLCLGSFIFLRPRGLHVDLWPGVVEQWSVGWDRRALMIGVSEIDWAKCWIGLALRAHAMKE